MTRGCSPRPFSPPIYQASDEVDACVTLVVPAAELDARFQRLVDTATRTAEAISLTLG